MPILSLYYEWDKYCDVKGSDNYFSLSGMMMTPKNKKMEMIMMKIMIEMVMANKKKQKYMMMIKEGLYLIVTLWSTVVSSTNN